MAGELGYHLWSAAEIALLRRDYQADGPTAMARRLGRSVHGVINKAGLLGLTRPDRADQDFDAARRGEDAPAPNARKPWTAEHLAEFRLVYQRLGVHGCAAKFGRSPHSITTKAGELGITDPTYRDDGRKHRFARWEPTEAEIAEAARVERAASLERKRKRLGIPGPGAIDDRDRNRPRLSMRMERGPTSPRFPRTRELPR
jgi:hypothetical protein